MANMNKEAAGLSRGKVFSSLIITAGKLKRGILISRMHVSEQTFAREYMSYLEQYPNIHYENREFSYSP